MKQFSQSLVVVPCHSLEDFPTHPTGHDAEDLLACWTAGWHPRLIATTQKQPGWQRADSLELEPDSLLIVPTIAHFMLEESFWKLAEQHNVTVISSTVGKPNGNDPNQAPFEKQANHHVANGRQEIAKLALSLILENQDAAPIEPDLVADFWALGYGYLQIQLMTRQLRYSSNLDEAEFSRHVVAAATLEAAGDRAAARQSLMVCFDLLLEEKNSYYPVQPDLLDLILTAPSTLGGSLSRQLERSHKMNLLLTGMNIKSLIETSPRSLETVDTIRKLVDASQLEVIGGLEAELPDPLLANESVIRQMETGRKTFKNALNVVPVSFARRRFGLTQDTPGLLNQFNFNGVLHTTFDEGTSPTGSSCNIRWTGHDGQSIPAFGDLSHDACDASTFLRLGLLIGEQIDSAHVAAVLFAHWPDQGCDSFMDLIRICQYGPLLGQWVRLQDYFDSIYDPGYEDTFSVDEYKTPYLKQAIRAGENDPISRTVRYWELHFRIAGCRSAWTQLAVLASFHARQMSPELMGLGSQIQNLEFSLDAAIASPDKLKKLATQAEEFEKLLINIGSQIFPRPVESVQTSGATTTVAPAKQSSGTFLALNPNNGSRRAWVSSENDEQATPVSRKAAGAIVLAHSGPQTTDWIVEVPGTGFIEVNPANSTTEKNPKTLVSDPPVWDSTTLRNEFFELQIDEKTGGIRSLQDYRGRTNRISQRLSLRMPGDPHPVHRSLTTARYAEMVADEIKGSSNSLIRGEICSRGRLIDGELTVATFRQRITVTRGLPILDVEIEIEPKIELTDSINHYFCNRLAWKEESTEVVANAQETRQHVNSDWFLATQFFELRPQAQSGNWVTVLTGGLPFHRRASRTMMDSPLIASGESGRKFRLGIGVDVRYPMMAATQWMTPLMIFPTIEGAGSVDSGWLFHFDCKNILVTWWQPQFDVENHLTGVQIRMRETEGRSGDLTLRCAKTIRSAERLNFMGDYTGAIQTGEGGQDQVSLNFSGFDFFQILLNFK